MTFDEYIGLEYFGSDTEPNYSVWKTQAHHLNPTRNINGGVFLAMADNRATGAASRAYFEKFATRAFMVGVDLHAVMLANQQGDRIEARATIVRVGKPITVVRTRVTGDDDKLLAEVTSTHVPVPPASPVQPCPGIPLRGAHSRFPAAFHGTRAICCGVPCAIAW